MGGECEGGRRRVVRARVGEREEEVMDAKGWGAMARAWAAFCLIDWDDGRVALGGVFWTRRWKKMSFETTPFFVWLVKGSSFDK